MSRRRYTPGAVGTGVALLGVVLLAGVQEANREVIPTVATTIRGTAGEEVTAGGTVVEVGEAWSTTVVDKTLSSCPKVSVGYKSVDRSSSLA